MNILIFVGNIIKFLITIVAIVLIIILFISILPVISKIVDVLLQIVFLLLIILSPFLYYIYLIMTKYQKNFQKFKIDILENINNSKKETNEIKDIISKYFKDIIHLIKAIFLKFTSDKLVRIFKTDLKLTLFILKLIFFKTLIIYKTISSSDVILLKLEKFISKSTKDENSGTQKKLSTKLKNEFSELFKLIWSFFLAIAFVVILFELISIKLNLHSIYYDLSDLKRFLSKQQVVFQDYVNSSAIFNSFNVEEFVTEKPNIRFSSEEITAWINRKNILNSIDDYNMIQAIITDNCIQLQGNMHPDTSSLEFITKYKWLHDYLNRTIYYKIDIGVESRRDTLIIIPKKVQLGMLVIPSETLVKWIMTKFQSLEYNIIMKRQFKFEFIEDEMIFHLKNTTH